MPKKFQGVNTKAAEARARKAEKHTLEQQRKLQAAEDESWRDDDKSNARKQQRKEALEQKRLNNVNKKKLLDDLYQADQELVGKSAKPSTSKVTRADIEKLRKEEEKDKATKQQEAALGKKNISTQDDLIEENINKAVSESLADGSTVEARSVEEAISALGVQSDLDRHPERRLKASFKKYEEEYMPILKAENPSMRLSQLRQILRKQWQKSPENPLNQSHKSYNAK
uniref:Coiled-coil domain-containing protein 124-like n=1 Tax=Phallusia mammillata TaxID=59560 RepID=A0A6F9D7W9_9ASCI|nr:coiled-coil domain-containing protein 124-like [Phallusia mammillata]